jgi:hypothetical protein
MTVPVWRQATAREQSKNQGEGRRVQHQQPIVVIHWKKNVSTAYWRKYWRVNFSTFVSMIRYWSYILTKVLNFSTLIYSVHSSVHCFIINQYIYQYNCKYICKYIVSVLRFSIVVYWISVRFTSRQYLDSVQQISVRSSVRKISTKAQVPKSCD